MGLWAHPSRRERRRTGRAPRQRGAVLIEAAIIMPLLITLVMGIISHIDFARQLRDERKMLIAEHLVHGQLSFPVSRTFIVAAVLLIIGFIAIIWINHHYLMRFVGAPTLRLIWINFLHLFMVSLLPFATAWVARTRLARSPIAFYAGLFVCVVGPR